MIVVSDTSPLCYLALLDSIEILHRRFGEVICPPEVIQECLQKEAPDKLRSLAGNLPNWLIVRPAPDVHIAGVERLDRGESAAIRLAHHLKADLTLIDERKGRQTAVEAGLPVSGVLSVLADAGQRGWLDFDLMVKRLLTQTNFRVSPEVIAAVRRRIAGD